MEIIQDKTPDSLEQRRDAAPAATPLMPRQTIGS